MYITFPSKAIKQEYNDRDANGKMLRLSNRVCNSEEKLRKELTEEQQKTVVETLKKALAQ